MSNEVKEPRGLKRYPEDWELIDYCKVAWFTTRTVHKLSDDTICVWESRGHRKGLGLEVAGRPEAPPKAEAVSRSPWLTLWAPRRLTWWVAVLFMVGSFLFALGSLVGLVPQLFDALSQSVLALDLIFFSGSIFFTTAAYTQLLEAINAGEDISLKVSDVRRDRFRWLAWKPRNIGYMASLTQFIGTLLFNVSTFSAMVPWASWHGEERFIWRPTFTGSVLFMIASILALLEVCGSYWCLRARSISWWILALNLAGSIGFMISAIFAFITPTTQEPLNQVAVNVFTFQGAVCFFAGAYLLLPEMFSKRQNRAVSSR